MPASFYFQRIVLFAAGGLLAAATSLYPRPADGQAEAEVPHVECSNFGPQAERLRASGLAAEAIRQWKLSALTAEVTAKMDAGSQRRAAAEQRSAGASTRPANPQGIIDTHIFQAIRDAGAKAAGRTNDYEFARRVSLDLTGRVPTLERLRRFVDDTSPNKRAEYVNELLESVEWVDKWTMFFGDLFKNTARTTQVNRYAEGRNAFYLWIWESLQQNKPYNRIATELITARGRNSFEQGELNWLVGGMVTGGPRSGQDNFDQQAANTAETFLGIAHMNCILCHDGRRHLDDLSLWGRQAIRMDGYQLAAFFSRTNIASYRVDPVNPTRYYDVDDNRTFRVDYPLNTTTGNRPPRQPVGSIRNVAPVYPFSGKGPNPGENYREALARELTSDIQFARAAVNYIWKEFFGRGIVEPTNQFDLARLDPDHPPPAPWKLQPTHPRLLDALARDFIQSGFDIKALMRQIVNSEAYQMSSRFEGAWNPAWEPLFARKFVRRLWAEEIHDAIVQTSNIPTQYNIRGLDTLHWAMQLPEPFNLPGGAVTSFLDSFLRGNRDDEERRGDGSVSQALNLMNDSFVMSRTRATGTGASASLARRLLNLYPAARDRELVQECFLTILSRPATPAEMEIALRALGADSSAPGRQRAVEDLLWALYNKVDFIYNY